VSFISHDSDDQANMPKSKKKMGKKTFEGKFKIHGVIG
jgi:hypothetical protein